MAGHRRRDGALPRRGRAYTAGVRDRWAGWLLERRFGGDAAAFAKTLPVLEEFRDTVLDAARITATDTVLDVGCGDGLLGLGALDRANTVIFSDISEDLLDTCREVVGDRRDRCRFVHTGLPELDGIADGSVDVAMTRSVLIYVDDKAASLRTFHRVLRPGGRLSLFEPINRFAWPEPDDVLWGCDVTGVEALARKVKDSFEGFRRDAMVGFDERDLVRLAEDAGFGTITAELRVYVGPVQHPVEWETFLNIAPNPLAPTFGQALAEALEEDERAILAARLEERFARRRMRSAGLYLAATK